MPEKECVAAGKAEFSLPGKHSLKITASDKAIIHYKRFDIGEKEHVEFVQPSSKATVLNRIGGKDPSQILGSLKANGRVFFVNEQGFYFGPHASVHVGALIVSTLHIRDEDFLEGNFRFSQREKRSKGKIVNEGTLAASPEGCVAFFSSFIENKGSILARANLSCAESVTLDFSGDGLIQFSVDGDLKEALIENSGQIVDARGTVEISLRVAGRAIKGVVNTEGLVKATALEEDNGVIRLSSTSVIGAEKVHIDGGKEGRIDLAGAIAVSSEEKGGKAHLFGRKIALREGKIDASGERGGGEVLIGGDFQGKGEWENARFVSIDEKSAIYADAKVCGDGGKVIVWAEEETFFNGSIFARGGKEGGDGGFVETSGKEALGVEEQAYVDTSALKGKYGDWLLDPRRIRIRSNGNATIAQCSAPNCANNSNRRIRASTIAASSTNVSLCATRNSNSSITVETPILMNNPNVSLTLTAGSSLAGPISLSAPITTRGGAIQLNGSVVLETNISLDTTNGGASPGGADIVLPGTVDGPFSLSLDGGASGTVAIARSVGSNDPLTSLSARGNNIYQGGGVQTSGAVSYKGLREIELSGNITTRGGAISMEGPLTLLKSATLDTTNGGAVPAGAAIACLETLDGAKDLVLLGGTGGEIAFAGEVGSGTPLSSLTASGAMVSQNGGAVTTGNLRYVASSIEIEGDQTTSGGTISMEGAVTLTGTARVIDSTNGGASPIGADITFSSAVNGAVNLTVSGGSGGNLLFSGAIGNIASPLTLTASGLTVTQSSFAKASGQISYTGATSIGVGGNITTSGALITMTGPVSLTNAPTFDATNGGAFPAGAAITFSNRVEGGTALSLRAGTGGIVSLLGAVGGVTPLTNLSFISASQIQLGSDVTVSGANPLVFPFATEILDASNITSSNANISFSSTVDSDAALTGTLRLIAGSGDIALGGAVGGVTPLGTLAIVSARNVTAKALTLGALSQTSGTGTTTFQEAISTANLLGIDLTGTGFTFEDTVTTTNGGRMAIANGGVLSMPSGATCSLSGSFSQTGTGNVQSGNTIVSEEAILFTAPVFLTGGAFYDTNASSLTITFMSTIDSIGTTPFDLTLEAGTSNISILGDVGSLHPLGTFSVTQTNNLTIEGLVANGAVLSGGSGTVTVNGDVAIGSGGIVMTGTHFVSNGDVLTTDGGSVTITASGTATREPGHTVLIDGDYTLNGSGPAFTGGSLTARGNISITSFVTLTANTTLDTSLGNGSINFANTINGPNSLTLIAGEGDISIGGAVGNLTPIGNFTIASARNVDVQSIEAFSFRQLSGTGTTSLHGSVSTSGALGIVVVTDEIIREAAISTTGGGPLTLTNSALFTSTAPGAIAVSGPFTQNGSGNVSLGGTITTANANLSFSGPIALASAVSLNTGTAAGGDISLGQTVDGAFGLTLNSGSGNITLSGAVGGTTPLAGVAITRAKEVTTGAISAGAITQSAGSGTTTFSGALIATTSLGIALTGSSFTFEDLIVTSGGGPLLLTQSGVATFSSGSAATIGGDLTQTGTGSNLLSRAITVSGEVKWSGPTAIVGSAVLSTAAANQPITFFSTVDGPGDLVLETGTADLMIMGDAGATTPLGDVVLSTVGNFTAESFAARSLTQSSGLGETLFNGDVITSGAGGMHLTGEDITFVGNGTIASPGTIVIDHTGTLQTAAGKTLFGAGGVSQTGGGAVNLGGTIGASDADISFASAITLIADTTLSSGTTAGDITLGAVDGGFHLTFTAGRDISAGVIGGGVRLGTVTATTARNITAASITAAAIVQLAGSGTTSLTGDINTNSPLGISLVGNNFSRSGAIITTNGGAFSVVNTGLITGTSINTTSIDGSYTQTAASPLALTHLAGTITARLGIFIDDPILLVADAVLDTTGGNGDILVSGTIDSPYSLTLRAGAGNVSLSGDVGGVTPIGALILGAMRDFSAAHISSVSIEQEALSTLSGQATFGGSLHTSGASGIALNGNAFSFLDAVTAEGGGGCSLTNTGALLISTSSPFTLGGAFSQSGSGPVSLGNAIVTTNQDISFSAPITLLASSSLDSGSGIGSLTLAGMVNGDFSLTLNAGTGDIDLQSGVGQIAPLSSLTVQNGALITFQANTTVSGAFTIDNGTDTTTFSGAVTAESFDFTGALITCHGAFTATGGNISIGNSGALTVASSAPVTTSGSFLQTGAGAVSLGSNITTSSILSIASPLTLTDDVVLDSGNSDLTLGDTVSGSFNLTLRAGTGDIAVQGNAGATRLGVFTITSAHNVTVQEISAASMLLQNATGLSTLHGSLDTNGIDGIVLIGNSFISSGSVTTTNGGPLIVTNSGLVTATGASTITLSGGGSFLQNGTGPVNMGGEITTDSGAISHSGAVTVLLDATLTSNGGDISFLSTLDGPACLTLDAGSGDISFEEMVGGVTALGCLDATGEEIYQNSSMQITGITSLTGTVAIHLGGDIATSNADLTLAGEVLTTSSLSLSTGSGSGNIEITGSINGNAPGYDLTLDAGVGSLTLVSPVGDGNPFNDLVFAGSDISWAGLGGTTFGSTGTTSLTATNAIAFTGTTYRGGAQSYSAGSSFPFSSLLGVELFSSSAPISFATGTILLSSDLSMQTQGGDISFEALSGAGKNLSANADTGSFSYAQIGAIGAELNDVTLTSDNFSPHVPPENVFSSGTLTISSSNSVLIDSNQTISAGNIIYDSRVTIEGANITYSCGGGTRVIFNGRVDAATAGVDGLFFDVGSCGVALIFNGPIGSIAPLSFLSIDGALGDSINTAGQAVQINNVITVGELSITSAVGGVSIGAGITATTGDITIDASDGSGLLGSIAIGGSVTAGNGGSISLAHEAALTISPGSYFDIAGNFTETGGASSTVSIGAFIQTHDGAISFASPVVLSGSTTLASNDLSGGDLSFAETVDGAHNLTLSSGSGSILFSSGVGTSTPLVHLAIASAEDVTASGAIFASTLSQAAGTGISTFSAVTTTGTNGIGLTGNDFTFNGAITTTNQGPFLIDLGGTLTFASATYTFGGPLTQSGAGAVQLAGTFTSGGAISFTGETTLANHVSLDASANGGNISFPSGIEGGFNLELLTGSGSILCGPIGSSTPLLALTIAKVGTTVHNADFSSIAALSITQTSGTGTTTISGGMTTSGVSGIDLNSAQFSLSGDMITTNGGPFSLVNSNSSNLVLGSGTSISGAFSQSGGGEISLSGTLATANQPLSFADPITLTSDTSLSTGGGSGALTLSSRVDGNSALTLTAGTAPIVLGGALGSQTPLGDIQVVSASAITYSSVQASSIEQLGNSGTTTITGPIVTTGAAGIALSGNVIVQNGDLTANFGGAISLVHLGKLTVSTGVLTTATGGYSESGGGTVDLGGSIAATDSFISFNGAITLTEDISLIAGPTTTNSNAISLASAVTGSHALSLGSSGGSITCSADLGTVGSPLAALTITNADTVSMQGVFADAISQLAGSGNATFSGNLYASSSSGIALEGNGFTFAGTIGSDGPFILTNSGESFFQAGANGTISGAFTQNGTGTTSLASAITAGGAVTFLGPLTLSGTGSIDTSLANQPIAFFSSVDGPGNLTLAAGTGSITFYEEVGYGSRLGNLTVDSAGDLTFPNIRAISLVQTSGSSLTLFQGEVDTNGPLGLSLTVAALTFTENVTVSGGGPIFLSHTGALTTTIGKTLSSEGDFTHTGSGAVSLGSSIVTTGGAAISFSGSSPIALVAPISISSASGGGDISFSAASTVDGNYPLTLAAGAGDITISGNFGGGVRLGAFTIASAHDITVQAITANSLTQLSGSGTSTLEGILDTDTPAGITLIGNNFFVAPGVTSVTTTNEGSLTITNQGVVGGAGGFPTITLDGSLIHNGTGPVYFGSSTARQGISFASPAILATDAILQISSESAAIVFSSTLDGLTGTENLTLSAGTGDITFSSAIGATTPLGSLTATGEKICLDSIGTALSAGISGNLLLTASGEVAFTGTIYHANTQTYTGAFSFEMSSGGTTTFSSSGNPITFTGAAIELGTGTDLEISTSGGDLTLGSLYAQVGDQRSAIFDAGAGSIVIGDLGELGKGEFSSTSFTGQDLTLGTQVSDAMTFTYTGTLYARGNLLSTDTPLIFSNPVVLRASTVFSTVGAVGSDITFSSTLDGFNASYIFGLQANAGLGNLQFAASIGASYPLQGIVILAANNATFSSPVSLGTLVQQNGFGTTTISAPLTTVGGLGVRLSGNNITCNAPLFVLNQGPFIVTNSGLFTLAGGATLSGGLTQTGSGTVLLSSALTAQELVSFASPVALTGASSINTAAADQSISFLSAVSGSGSLTLAAGSGGDIAFSAAVGSSSSPIGAMSVQSCHDLTLSSLFADSLTLSSSTGVTTIGDLATNGSSGIDLNGNIFFLNGSLETIGGGNVSLTHTGLMVSSATFSRTVDGSYTQNGTGPVHFGGPLVAGGGVSFATDLTLLLDATLDTSANNQDIVFSGAVNGPKGLFASAGEGNIFFAEPVGTDVSLANLIVSSAYDITLHGIGTTASGIATAASGTQGALALAAAHDIYLPHTIYTANEQTYAMGNGCYFSAGALTELTSFAKAIAFTGGSVNLSSGTDLQVVTNNGALSFETLLGSGPENIVFDTGDGTASLGGISSSGLIGQLTVTGGNITFAAPIEAANISFVSLTNISNAPSLPAPSVLEESSPLITSPNTLYFNGLGGDVGTLSDPILVQTGGKIFAGADKSSLSLANFNGSSSDHTVHPIPSNPPCKIIFNGKVIKDCTCSCGPSASSFSFRFPFAGVGFDSSFFNLASDYFFFVYFFDENTVRRKVIMNEWK